MHCPPSIEVKEYLTCGFPFVFNTVLCELATSITFLILVFSIRTLLFADTGVDPALDTAREKAGIVGSKAVMNKKATKMGHRRMPLPPFGLAALYLTGDVWFMNGESDKEKYIDLNKAATIWLQKNHFYHHDFNFFANNSHIRSR